MITSSSMYQSKLFWNCCTLYFIDHTYFSNSNCVFSVLQVLPHREGNFRCSSVISVPSFSGNSSYPSRFLLWLPFFFFEKGEGWEGLLLNMGCKILNLDVILTTKYVTDETYAGKIFLRSACLRVAFFKN